VTFDYFEVKVANMQFKAMMRDLKYDIAAIQTMARLRA